MNETIYPLLNTLPGIGTTGTTLLLRQELTDTLVLNPLRFDPDAALKMRLPRDPSNDSSVQTAVDGNHGVGTIRDVRGVTVLAVTRAIPLTNWNLVVEQDEAEAFAPVADLTRGIVAVTLLVLLLSLSAALILARTLTQPLMRLASSARALARGNFDTPLPQPRGDELGQLAAAFTIMRGAVRDRESELAARVAELKLLNELSHQIATTFDLNVIAQATVGLLAQRYNNLLAGLLLCDSDSGDLLLYAAAGRGAPLLDAHTRVPFGRGIIGAAAQAHETRIVNETIHAADFIPLRGLDIRAEAAIPIVTNHELIGVLAVDADAPNAFSHGEVRLLETLAAQLAPAIENARLFRDLSAAYDHTLDALVAALDARDKETEWHSQRVVAYTLALARHLNIPTEELDTIRRGALLHDIGKIGIPDAILLKPGALSPEEREVIQRHPEMGERILQGIPFLKRAAEIVCTHQERWDGKGYPRGLGGGSIPVGARIFAVADTFDAITSDRPYRAGRAYAVARAEIAAGRGTQFDPQVVDAFMDIPESELARLRADTSFKQEQGTRSLTRLDYSWPEVHILNRMNAAFNNSLDLSDVLNEAARTVVQVLGAAAVGLFLYERETDMLVLAAEHGLPALVKTHFARFPVRGFHNESVVREGKVKLHGSPAYVADLVVLGLHQVRPDLGTYLCVPLIAHNTVNGVMGIFSASPRVFVGRDIALYCAIGEQIGVAITNARLHESVQQLALTDSLTGAYNRRHLENVLTRELARTARNRHPLALILLDVDDFKPVNDTFGHAGGDQLLQAVVQVLRENLRDIDVLARYGGDEFAVVLPETNLDGAHFVSEKLRHAIVAHVFPHGELTISLGIVVADTNNAASWEELLARADQALYQAKAGGGNRVHLAPPSILAIQPAQTLTKVVDSIPASF